MVKVREADVKDVPAFVSRAAVHISGLTQPRTYSLSFRGQTTKIKGHVKALGESHFFLPSLLF